MGAEVLYNEKSDVTKASGRTLSYGTGATYSVNDVARSDSVPPVMFTDEEMFSDVVSSALHLQSKKIYYEAFLVVMPLFCGYATLFSLQGELSKKLIPPNDPDESTHNSVFGVAVSMLYIGNLIFRLGHNIVFFFGSPRVRVLISMSSMCLSMAILAVIMFSEGTPNFNVAVTFVFIAYILGGVAVGSFESNILATVSGTHESTKIWAIIAMPVGVNAITIVAFLVFGVLENNGIQPHYGYVYVFVFAFVVVGVVIFLLRLYRLQMSPANNFSLREFFGSFAFWREWLWHIKWNGLALMFDMFCVSLFSPGIELYLYNSADTKCVDFYGYKMNPNNFIAMYNVCFFLGDTSSRKLLHMVRVINPFWFLLLSASGVVIGLSGVPEIVPLCAFLVSFANGSIYVQSTMVIKSQIIDRFVLVSLSTWLFVGDIGSVIGSNIRPSLQSVVQPLVPICTPNASF